MYSNQFSYVYLFCHNVIEETIVEAWELQSPIKLNEITDILHQLCYYSLFGTLSWLPLLPPIKCWLLCVVDVWSSFPGKIGIPTLSMGGEGKEIEW